MPVFLPSNIGLGRGRTESVWLPRRFSSPCIHQDSCQQKRKPAYPIVVSRKAPTRKDFYLYDVCFRALPHSVFLAYGTHLAWNTTIAEAAMRQIVEGRYLCLY
jgi:hypothetical protein